MAKLLKPLVVSALLCCSVAVVNAQFTQQGSILVGTDSVGNSNQGGAVALSADGNTAIVGGYGDNHLTGASWLFTRSGGVWTQQGSKLVGSGAMGYAGQGISVALSADGNTALVGGFADNNDFGAAWVFTRSNTVWSQQGSKLVGLDIAASEQGWSVALSADGDTALIMSPVDLGNGMAWIFTRSGGTWTQQGSALFPTADPSVYTDFRSVALSADGNTALLGGLNGRTGVAEAWVFTRSGSTWSQQAGNVSGSDEIIPGGGGTVSVALSVDGNTALLGSPGDNNLLGATWVFTRSGGAWSQQAKLVGSGSVPDSSGAVYQGYSVAISGDGNAALVGGPGDSGDQGAAWLFRRSGNVWNQSGDKLVGQGAKLQGASVALSADGYTALVGATGSGVFVFVSPKPTSVSLSSSLNPSRYGQVVTYTGSVTVGAMGAVTFAVDGIAQSTVPLTGSIAQFSIANLTPGSHIITAAYSGDQMFQPSSATVNQTVNPLGVISLWANTEVNLSASARVPVSVASPAPAPGLTIYLTSSDPSKVTVTPSVFIPTGRTSPNVQPLVTALNLGTVSITASALGYTPATQSVYVEATLAFAGCCVAIYGLSGNAVLTLSSPAPQGGLTIQLVSDNPKVATVPPTITFPAYMTSVSVPITRVASGMAVVHASDPPYLPVTSIRVTVP